ncbi:unnamed protein product [Knipowitschia caucasica]|uniref:Uncharacterized protein n=1 Tax=Knipowitschia caucasica TaxID=637954 RepID=A0AAV2L8H6_KNICA
MGDENTSEAELESIETEEGVCGEAERSSVQSVLGEVNAQSPSASSSDAASDTETMVNFVRSFLSQMGMTDTLDCLQAEWHDMAQHGQITSDAKQFDVTPYLHDHYLENELKSALNEREQYKQAITAAEEALVKIRKSRDFHWLRHNRLLQEKNKLLEDIRKLTAQCKEPHPKLKQMKENYQKLLRQIHAMDIASVQAKEMDVKSPQYPTSDESDESD